MPLPDAFLDELRARVSIADVVGRKVTWDTRKSNPGKGDWWAPCPFHQEKTASFHVDDKQGYYYCFGCHAKGNAITFLRELEGFSFRDAVEELARQAGMEMPAEDPRARARAEKRATLSDVMERAVAHFRTALGTPAGGAARDYLARRGLDAAALARFEIGYAPAGWDGMRDALTSREISVEQLLACGLVRPSDKGRQPYDTFRDRIMFPIRDARGRAIAFGGRAMDPDDNAKYLNSPDTELFDKGRTLYNHGPARAAAAKGAPLIVAEGYMDVIALARAGFEGAVAPLGTAVTEEQLRLLWRMHPEPVVALDGDRAGLQAGERLMDLALPHLSATQSLRFALLPAGQDPDDLIRAGGPEAIAGVIDGARPVIDLLWDRETRGRVFDSPERRAGLDLALGQAVSRIADADLRGHYGRALREKRNALFGYGQARKGKAPSFPPAGGRRRDGRSGWTPPAVPLPETRDAARDAAAMTSEDLREAVILASLMSCPILIETFADALEETEFRAPRHAEIAAALLACDVLATSEAVRADLSERLGFDPLETLTAPRHVRISPALRRPHDTETARQCVASELARLEAARGVAREIEEAKDVLGRAPADWGQPEPMGEATFGMAEPQADYGPGSPLDADPDLPEDAEGEDAMTWRLREAARVRREAEVRQEGNRAEFDVAPNGVRIDRSERADFENLLQRIGHETRESPPDPDEIGDQGRDS